MTDTPTPPPDPAPVRNAELKAGLLLALMVLLVAATAVYLMYARGAFEATQRLLLQADDSEGVVVGMDLTYAGFPIGRVRRIELAPDGKARVVIDVPQKDAHWLRSSSIFTLERAVVGGAKLRAYSGVPTDPPLENGAQRPLLVGDATAEIPRILSAVKDVLQNLNQLTGEGSALEASLRNVKGMTDKLNGPGGAMSLVAGDDKKAQLLLQRASELLVTVDAATRKADSLMAHADSRLFDQNGMVNDAQTTVRQLNALLADARASLKKADAVLADAQVISGNARVASADLGTLRAEVETSLRRVEQLVNEINRKWPFKQDTEIKLP
ncbi:MCE family protein [Duganella sp. LX20W]|uniref:MCE family protein n=1 Tax=Rugamonas brunnea TaxID=2758569 RepID=A0A7W2ENK5_9BURK|nr:MlaD family protein [Rugamonas brunnea]MBA5635733.1 MCE family protein [Rugamonas brunnea]